MRGALWSTVRSTRPNISSIRDGTGVTVAKSLSTYQSPQSNESELCAASGARDAPFQRSSTPATNDRDRLAHSSLGSLGLTKSGFSLIRILTAANPPPRVTWLILMAALFLATLASPTQDRMLLSEESIRSQGFY